MRFFTLKFVHNDQVVYGITNYTNSIWHNNYFYTNKYNFAGIMCQIQSNSSITVEIYENIQISQVQSSSVTVSSVYIDELGRIVDEKIIFYGYVINIRQEVGLLSCEISAINNKLNKQYGSFYSSLCRAQFGDNYCKVNEFNYSHNGYVVNQIDNYQITIQKELTKEVEKILFYKNNDLIWQSNVIHCFNLNITLFDSIPSQINLIGCAFVAIEKCYKSVESCKKFNNIVNFRGEPFINNKTS